MVTGSRWLADKYFRRQETESVGIFATGNTGEFSIHFTYCPASPSEKTVILFGLSCRTPPAACAEWRVCTAAAWCRGCERLGKTFGSDLPGLWQLGGHNEQPRAERCQELREPQESRRVIRGMGKKEKGSGDERSELKNQSTRAKGELCECSGGRLEAGRALSRGRAGGGQRASSAQPPLEPQRRAVPRGREPAVRPSSTALGLSAAALLARGFWQPVWMCPVWTALSMLGFAYLFI